ncbi:hypothetical protein RJ640_028816 [Escallonia rubra]|uniref:F-box domain-containing protein n=1 Tax=Escallonia rubra TaxID=112253 RepID=A0AA88RJJ8_9ASTE|nr:hypothetical protein RJ640_028817 [Escallonia rubra]KAK2991039.1 hypothetical protein RJ640_028816 [Escallonia rubra]
MASVLALPDDLLVNIAEKVALFEDFVALRGVCKSWQSAAAKGNFSNRPQIPWLMLAAKEGSDVREFYSLSKDMILRVTLPEANEKRCRCLASEGWLITIGKDLNMSLLHPISGIQIRLPHISTLKDHEASDDDDLTYVTYIRKAVLSSSASSSSCTVMIIQGDYAKLAFCKLGIDNAWTTVETRQACYLDVIHFNAMFYAIDCRGAIFICNVEGPNPTAGELVTSLPRELHTRHIEYLYLVESSGKLLVVSRIGVEIHLVDPVDEENSDFEENSELTYGTTGFQVFEVEISNGGWKEVKTLGGRALFLGHNSSFSVEAHGCIKADCIYFTDDALEAYVGADNLAGGKDMGIYNMQHGSITPHFDGESYSEITPPMWVAPSF